MLEEVRSESLVVVSDPHCGAASAQITHASYVTSLLTDTGSRDTYRHGVVVEVHLHGLRQIDDELVLHRDFNHILKKLDFAVDFLRYTCLYGSHVINHLQARV